MLTIIEVSNLKSSKILKLFIASKVNQLRLTSKCFVFVFFVFFFMQAMIQIANRKQRDIFGKQIILAITYFIDFKTTRKEICLIYDVV